MKTFSIITDSTSDLTKELREKYDISYVRMNITANDKEFTASLDWDEYSPKELYDWMRNGTRIYTTQVPNSEFEKAFRASLEEGKDVLYIACSSALSGSYNASLIVAKEVLKDYKDGNIICVDALNSSMGEGSMAIAASKLRDEGKSIDEVAKEIESMKLTYNQVATVESLEYLKRAGRVKANKAFFGNLFGIKPIIISDAKGQNYAYTKIKGRNASLNKIADDVRDNIVDSENQYIYITHADDEKSANDLKNMILDRVKCKGVCINYIGPIVGASVGPGTIAAYFKGKEVTVVEEN